MHADMTAVTIQPKKIVLNEVEVNWALLEPSYGLNIMDFLAKPIYVWPKYKSPEKFISS